MTKQYVRKDWHLSPDPRKRLGVFGEDIVCEYLKKHGFIIIERNVRFPIGEIDIVAIDNNRVIGFVGYGDRGDEAPYVDEIFALYVLSDYYGTDVGFDLMKAGLNNSLNIRKYACGC